MKEKIRVGMVTWRVNSSRHYIKDGEPLCGADVKYGEVWYADESEPTCNHCKSIYKRMKNKGDI